VISAFEYDASCQILAVLKSVGLETLMVVVVVAAVAAEVVVAVVVAVAGG
jgi:hypothetical protein